MHCFPLRLVNLVCQMWGTSKLCICELGVSVRNHPVREGVNSLCPTSHTLKERDCLRMVFKGRLLLFSYEISLCLFCCFGLWFWNFSQNDVS